MQNLFVWHKRGDGPELNASCSVIHTSQILGFKCWACQKSGVVYPKTTAEEEYEFLDKVQEGEPQEVFRSDDPLKRIAEIVNANALAPGIPWEDICGGYKILVLQGHKGIGKTHELQR